MIKLIAPRKFIVPMLACLLCSCGTAPSSMQNSSHAPSQEQALQQADKFLRLAKKGETDEQVKYRLMAIEQLIAAKRIEQAEQLLTAVSQLKLNTDNTAYKQILLAQLSLAKQNPAQAQQELSAIWTPLKLPEYLKIKFYSTSSDAYISSGNLIEAVQERLYLAKHLKSPAEIKDNNHAIWDTLSQVPASTLSTVQKSHGRDELSGWISFTTITKQYDPNPDQMVRALAVWKENFPGHPAISFMSEPLAQRIPETTYNDSIAEYSRSKSAPGKIALLLPLHGPHAQSAQAVRDGFLAAYYAQKDGPGKPKIQVYDTAGQEDLHQVYRQAVDDGADFVVGPLIKEEVEAISYSSRPKVPVLALNIILDRKAQDNVYQFGLSPEMEAQAVADKAWRDGHRNALIIVPKSAWGKRMQTAFQDHWRSLGGKILAVEEIQSQTNLNKEIQRLLGIDASEERAKELKQLGLKFNFDPRRRQDPDMVFIATNPALARQVKPLLNFYYAAKLPAYASSSIFNGRPQPGLDQDLNGIQFCDMPWILDSSIRSRETYKSVSELWPKEFEQYARLFALGLDAYKIALQIDQLTMLPDLGISGMTGMLTMDQQHKIQRKLMWASFRKGVPHINGDQ